jgi:hypothetical protein
MMGRDPPLGLNQRVAERQRDGVTDKAFFMTDMPNRAAVTRE